MRRSTTVLALWTLFVWGTRLRNALRDDDSVASILLAGSFLLLAAVVLLTKGHAFPGVVLGGWTVVVWAVRAVDIAFLSDHGAAFVVVHVALAAVSFALVAWVDRDLSGPRLPAAVRGRRRAPG